MKRDLLTLTDLTATEIHQILRRAGELKKRLRAGKETHTLKGKSLAMIFEKASTRTKVSFDVAMFQLGGHAVTLQSETMQLGRGETYRDTGRVLSRYVDGIVMRTSDQENMVELAKGARVPVINGLSDMYHPCQVLTDLFTIAEEKKGLDKITVAYVGDGNNMAHSWIMAALVLGLRLRVGTPKGYEPDTALIEEVHAAGKGTIEFTTDPWQAVAGADVINADTWFSMGQEVTDEKRKLFSGFQLNAGLLAHAAKGAIVLHCLPAHRGEEITDEVLDGPSSRVWDQAENRLHVQKAILEMLLG